MSKTLSQKHNLVWIDYVRVLACLMVVLAHSVDPFVASGDPVDFQAGAIWGSFYRPAVPLFIMISGALLIPTNLRLGEFYNKRLKRILIPFAFWSILSPILFYVFTQGMDPVMNPSVSADNHTIGATLNNLWIWLFSFNYSTVPYWYIYMMIGLYLIIPVISSWVAQATKKELHILLGIWLFTTFLQYIEIVLPSLGYMGNYGTYGIYGDCSWNTFDTFQYVSGFLGYALLGYYFRKYPIEWSMKKTVFLCTIAYAVGYAFTFEGFHWVRNNFPDNFNMLEIPWSYTSFNVMLMTVPFFVLIQKINF